MKVWAIKRGNKYVDSTGCDYGGLENAMFLKTKKRALNNISEYQKKEIVVPVEIKEIK
jgi:hypothetical protein